MQNTPPLQPTPANQTHSSQRALRSVYDVPTGGRQYANTQFAQPGVPTMGGGTNMLASPAQQARPGGPIWTWDQMNQVDRQVEEELGRHPGVGQWVYINQMSICYFINHYSLTGMLSLAFCLRVNTFFHILRDRDIIFRRVNQLGVTMERKLRVGPRFTQAHRTQGHRANISRLTAGTFGGTPPTFLPLSSEAGQSQFYDHRGDSLDSDGNPTARMSDSSDRNYQY
jgi:hypothetical protein